MTAIAGVTAILALLMAWGMFRSMMKNPEGTPTMVGIARIIREGAHAYLARQNSTVAKAFFILAGLLLLLAYLDVQNPFVPVAFLTGGFFSALAGTLGMKTSTHASSRTAYGCMTSLNLGLRISFKAGSVSGLIIVGLGLLDIWFWYSLLDQLVFTPEHLQHGLSFAGLTLVHGDQGYTLVGGALSEAGEHYKFMALTTTLLTFGMGASLNAIFARLGGGIYTKAADVGADLVGKVEAGIPEDDPRNPATIADNVGDNVGDIAGMGADLFESYVGAIIGTMVLGAAMRSDYLYTIGLTKENVVLIPLILASIGTLFSMGSMFLIRTNEGADQKQLLKSLLMGTGGASLGVLLMSLVLSCIGFLTWGFFASISIGVIAGFMIGQITEYYTSEAYSPTRGIAEQAKMGSATTVLAGIAVGKLSVGLTGLVIVTSILTTFDAAGLYGILLAAVGMLSTLGITMATDAYGPIADNAGGIAEMCGTDCGPEVRKRTDALDSLGNTTAAIGKGFALGSAALTALGLIAAYLEEIRMWIDKLANTTGSIIIGHTAWVTDASNVITTGHTKVVIQDATMADFVSAFDLSLTNPVVIAGLFLGTINAFVFSAVIIKAVSEAAGAMVTEVRRQFQEIPGIMDYVPGDMSQENQARKPEYARCVEIATRSAQEKMKLPALLGVLPPVLIGIVMGIPGVIALLIGTLLTGFGLAVYMNNSGGAWDNAKKYIEAGHHGGRRSDAHVAAVQGDTVGDPFKDTAGPALNIFIKLQMMTSVVFSGLTVYFELAGVGMLVMSAILLGSAIVLYLIYRLGKMVVLRRRKARA